MLLLPGCRRRQPTCTTPNARSLPQTHVIRATHSALCACDLNTHRAHDPKPARGMEKLAPSERHQFIHGGQVVYEWDQTVDDVNVYIRTPPGLKASMMRVDIQSKKLSVGVKGEKPYIDVRVAALAASV